jgi:hypothetical protein
VYEFIKYLENFHLDKNLLKAMQNKEKNHFEVVMEYKKEKKKESGNRELLVKNLMLKKSKHKLDNIKLWLYD